MFTYNRKEQWQPYLLKPRSVPSWLPQLKPKWQGLLRAKQQRWQMRLRIMGYASLYQNLYTAVFPRLVLPVECPSENYTVIGNGVIFLFRFHFEINVLLPDLDLSIHHWVVWLCRLWNRSTIDSSWSQRCLGRPKRCWNAMLYDHMIISDWRE